MHALSVRKGVISTMKNKKTTVGIISGILFIFTILLCFGIYQFVINRNTDSSGTSSSGSSSSVSSQANTDSNANTTSNDNAASTSSSISNNGTTAPFSLSVTNESTASVSSLLYGLFLEDINYSVDGGLYGELIKNRSFEFGTMATNGPLHNWQTTANVTCTVEDGTTDSSYLNENNPHYLKMENPLDTYEGIGNLGYFTGLAVVADNTYHVSLYLKSDENYTGPVLISLRDQAGNIYGEASIDSISSQWWKYEVTITASTSVNTGLCLYVLMEKGSLEMDMVSMFPSDTFNDRENGLRNDLATALKELSPKFIRFPGGCVVEGENLENAYNWKDSIGDGLAFKINDKVTYGDVASRPLAENIWGTQASESRNPYYMTYGMGFYEYFLLCEDLDALAVPIVNCGMSCQIQGTSKTGTAVDALDLDSAEFKQYIQDALDLVEFCKGGADTKWGAIRIAMGHQEPFDLKYIGIGNEQWGYDYFSRYEAFLTAFQNAAVENPDLYGDIQLIVANGPAATDRNAWNKINVKSSDFTTYAGLVDEHYYCNPQWFLQNNSRYDSYDRNNVSVFLGEYAAQSNTLEAALAEASYMTGLERNGDVVKLASYAPLFCNMTTHQWEPDMIWYNNTTFYPSINYYIQKLFSNNQSSSVLKTEFTGNDTASKTQSIYQVTGTDETGDIIIKLVNVTAASQKIAINLSAFDFVNSKADVWQLSGTDPTSKNNLIVEDRITIENTSLTVSNSFFYEVPMYSATVIRIHTK